MFAVFFALQAMIAAPPEPTPVGRQVNAPGSPLSEGQKAPAFKLRSLDGTMVRLDEIAYPGKEKSWAKKKHVMIDFFRTDCGPCRTSMPELVEIARGYEAKGLRVVLIALLEPEDGRAKLEKYLAEQQLPFTVVVDETEHFSKKFLGGSVTLPATFLIDREGVIRRIKQGAKGSMKAHFAAAIGRLFGGS